MNTIKDNNDQIDLKELFLTLWDGKVLIIICISALSLIALIYSLILPNIYTSKTVLQPSQDSRNSLIGGLGAYSGIANFAGINLPSSSSSESKIAIETLKSFKFFEQSFLPNIKLEDLMAVDYWDQSSTRIYYEDSIFLSETNSWVRKPEGNRGSIPSVQEAHERFLSEHLSYYEDKETGLITLLIDHKSPLIAREWLEILVKNINFNMREQSKERSIRSVEFLTRQIAKTSYSEVKQALSNILQKESEKLMLVEVNEDYVFQTLDPPIAPEKKSKPQRLVILILAAIIGGILGSILVLIRFYQK